MEIEQSSPFSQGLDYWDTQSRLFVALRSQEFLIFICPTPAEDVEALRPMACLLCSGNFNWPSQTRGMGYFWIPVADSYCSSSESKRTSQKD